MNGILNTLHTLQGASMRPLLIAMSGAFFGRGIAALSGIVIAWTLTQQEFGTVALLNSILTLAPLALHLGLRQAFWIEAMHVQGSQRKELLNTILILYTFLACCIITVLWTSGLLHYCCTILGSWKLTLLLIAYCYLQFFSELYLVILRLQQRITMLTWLQVISGIITLSGNLFFTGWMHWSVTGILLANTLGIGIIVLIGALLYMQQGLYRLINKVHLHKSTVQLLKLGLPFVPNIIFYWLMTSSTRWFLAFYTNQETVALFAFADYAPQLITQLIIQPLNSTYIPSLIARYNSGNIALIERENHRFIFLINLCLIILSCSGALIGYVIAPYIFPAWCQEAMWLVTPLAMLAIASFNYQALTTILAWQKKPYSLFIITLGTASMHCLGVWQLTKHYGLVGTTLAIIITSTIYTALSYVIACANLLK